MNITVHSFNLQANLEMNKEGIFADLVCLLEVDLKEHKTAKLKEQMERFFIDGATRIDLIAQVMELDNNIGTYNYDIANLRETARQIQTVSKSKGKRDPGGLHYKNDGGARRTF